MENLKEKTISGLFWNLTERVGLRIVQFLPSILLARLLSPNEFGLVGMLTIFVLLAQTFIDSGFGVALIQKKNVDYTDECSIFYFNVVVGGLIVLLLFFAAPWIAAFYNQPTLIPLTRWLSLDILLKSFSLIQTTILTREMDFKTQVKANLAAALLGGGAGVAAAYAGLGVWSLVIQTLANSALRTLALWALRPWRPALLFSLSAIKGMFDFGSRLLTSSLITVFFDNLYQVIIGKAFSAAILGLYTRANSLRSVVVDTTSNSFGIVLFPALASIQDDDERLRRVLKKSLTLINFVHFPMMALLIILAKPIIVVLFSEKWLQAAVYLQLMCTAGLLYPLQVVNLQILKVKGRSDLYLKLNLIRRGLITLNIALLFPWGVDGILVGQIFVAMIAYFVNSYYSERLIGYSVWMQIKDILPSLFFSGLMAAGVFTLALLLQPLNAYLTLFLQISAGALLYAGLNWLARSESLRELLELTARFGFSPTKLGF